MIPSSISNKSIPKRPSSSHSSRPPSRSALRPSSSATERPLSNLATTRPGSNASTRPQSRFSQRPQSRLTRSRLLPFCHSLVSQVTGLTEDGSENGAEREQFRETVEGLLKKLDSTTMNKASASVDMSVIDKQIHGHSLKARLNSRDVLGEALETAYSRLKAHVEQQGSDLDQEIKKSHLPDHLQLLVALSRPPSIITVEAAKLYVMTNANSLPHPPTLTWADILAEEPFEGEHWEGVYGLPPGSVRNQTENMNQGDLDSAPSLSPLSSDDLALDEDDSFSSSGHEEPPSPPSTTSFLFPKPESTRPSYIYEHRKQFEELRAKQYWRDDWHTDALVGAPFEIGDPSTLGPTLARILACASGFQDAQAMLQPEHYIDEDAMVREILMILQGNRNSVLSWKDGAFTMTSSTPRLIHLSLASQESIITSLAKKATTLAHLRRFTSEVFSSFGRKQHSQKPTFTRTCEAFADAVDEVVRDLDAWCAAKEEAICQAYTGANEESLVVSMLGTERSIHDKYESSFEVLLDIVHLVFQVTPGDYVASFEKPARRQPATLTALLLDTLFTQIQQHMERHDTITSDTLMRVFVKTAEPVWAMIGRWLKDGMGLGLGIGTGGTSGKVDELDDEFFIESSGIGVGMMGMGLLDPEFWKEGYSLREGITSFGDSAGADDSVELKPTRKAIPLFLEHVAELVLSTGKAVGLLRALRRPPLDNPFAFWRKFADVIGSENVNGAKQKNSRLFSVSIDTLSRLIFDDMLSHCQTVGTDLVKVLVNDCAVWKHLDAIEDLFLMRKGDAISHFIDVLFTKMDSTQLWGDFHFLNAAFDDVIEANRSAGAKEWINAHLVRLSYRGNREMDRSIKRTVKSINGLCVEYAVPFPLTYIFTPKVIQCYSDIFVFLLQIRKAKNSLEKILVRGERGRGSKLREEMKGLYAMRSRLSWFINTLLNFLTTNVLHSEVSRFQDAFRDAQSLDEMITAHDEHLEKIRGRCLLKYNTSALLRAIISILDICLHFSDGFITFSGDTSTLDVSRQSISMRRHRSRRQRRQRKDVIGFSESRFEEDDSSDEDEEIMDVDTEKVLQEGSSFSIHSSSVLSEDHDFFANVDRMSSELDGLVKFLRRGIESLASGTGEAAPAFGTLAFSLEDWDI